MSTLRTKALSLSNIKLIVYLKGFSTNMFEGYSHNELTINKHNLTYFQSN